MRITLANLSKTYPGTPEPVVAVRDLSLDVNDGELLVVLGPSGCGKTTILRMIAGLERPSAGDVLFAGRRMTKVRPAHRNVGFVFQQPVLYPHLNVRDNLAFVLRRHQLTQAERDHRIQQTAQLFHIDALLARKPGQISVGEQQRVSLARGVLRQPSCLLLDEPLASLDAPLRSELRREIRAAHGKLKLTSIFVTHDQQEAFALADRVALLKDGRLQQLAAPMEMYRTPANAFVAKFIGSPGMNLIKGTIERDAQSGRAIFSTGAALRLAMPAHMASTEPREVAFGVRPEDVAIIASGPPADSAVAPFEIEITMIEALGDYTVIHARTRADTPILIKTHESCELATGDSARASIRPEAMHFFEPGENGRRIE
jgi:ABC-type sugar transport system ATPase subunit